MIFFIYKTINFINSFGLKTLILYNYKNEEAMIEVVIFKHSNKTLAALSMRIRQKVFVEEQGVDATLEYDGKDEDATHYLLYADGLPVGTARRRLTPNGIKLERFALLPECRNKGLGSKLLEEVMKDISETGLAVYLHAQEKAVTYYLRAGFKIEGEAFYEAGIRHFKMRLGVV